MTSFSPILNQGLEQGKLVAAVDFKKKKVQKNMGSNACNRFKFAKIARKNLLCTEMQEIWYLEFDHSGTLKHAQPSVLVLDTTRITNFVNNL